MACLHFPMFRWRGGCVVKPKKFFAFPSLVSAFNKFSSRVCYLTPVSTSLSLQLLGPLRGG